jgi:hypothetical protein
MAMQQVPPRQLLIQQLPELFPEKERAWLGRAASVLSRTNAEAIAGIIALDNDLKCGFVEQEVEAAGVSSGFIESWVLEL